MDVGTALARLLAAPIAHRGLHACGAPGPVENSLAAAEAAIEGGYGIECDIKLSRDGEAMVFHDDDLSRLIGVAGRLAEHDAAGLAAMRLRGGLDRIQTLEAFLARIGGSTPLVIEIKSDFDGDMRLTDRAMSLVADYAGVVALESFDPAIARRCRAVARCPVGLVGPLEDMPPDPAALAASHFVSWDVRRLGMIADFALPRSTWTVRTRDQRDEAERHRAQIVFEGFRPEGPPQSADDGRGR